MFGDRPIPAFYSTWCDPGLLVTQYRGHMRPDDVLGTLLRYLEDPDFDPAHAHLVDLQQTTELDFDFGRMMRLVSRLEPYYARRSEGARTAILAPRDVAFGIARMYQSLLGDRPQFEIGVFRDRDAAAAFLGLSPDFAVTLWEALDRDPEPLRAAAPSLP